MFEGWNLPAIHSRVAILTHNGKLVTDAAVANAAVANQLPANYVADAIAALAKVNADVAGQKTAHGELGNLTPLQHTNLDTLQYWMQQARETAKLAFPGQTVKLLRNFKWASILRTTWALF
jgi:uncharacterized protein YccT (UPF0319 family)